MNWLLLTLSDKASDFIQLRNYFEDQQIPLVTLEADEHGYIPHKGLTDALAETVYCIIDSADILSNNKDIVFAIGYMLGKGVSIFMTGRPDSPLYNYFSEQIILWTDNR